MKKMILSIDENDISFDSFQLDGVWYGFDVAYNDRMGRYYLDLYFQTSIIIGGLVLNPSVELLLGHAVGNQPKGGLFLMGDIEIEDDVKMKGLVGDGKPFNLFYIEAT